MFSLLIQTVLLMAIAFISGAILGCLLRNLFSSSEKPETTDTAADTTQTSVSEPAPLMTAAPPKPPKPVKPARPAEKAKVVAPIKKAEAKPKPKPKPKKPAAKAPAKAATKAPVKTPVKAPVKAPAKTKKVAAKTTAAAVKIKKPAMKTAAKSSAAATESKKVAAPAKAKKVPAKSKPIASNQRDNLKLIQGIGPKNEARLNALGVKQFAQIADWKKKDTVHFGETLAFPGRIEREKWVSQAKVLARGGTTKFSKRVKSGNVDSSIGKIDPTVLGKKPKGMLKTARKGQADKLTGIDGVGPAIEKRLNNLGVFHFDQIVKMSKPELTWLGNNIGSPGRPEREDWVKDAKVLAAQAIKTKAKPAKKPAAKKPAAKKPAAKKPAPKKAAAKKPAPKPKKAAKKPSKK